MDTTTSLPFHQHPHHDEGGELRHDRIGLLNVLIPFIEFDGTCPDIELVAHPLTKLLPVTTSPETQFSTFELDEGPILDTFADYRWRPRLAVGDVVIFRDGTLHRTFSKHPMTRQRTRIDMRVFARRERPEP